MTTPLILTLLTVLIIITMMILNRRKACKLTKTLMLVMLPLSVLIIIVAANPLITFGLAATIYDSVRKLI